jgi:hypothetical protein
MYIQLGRKRGQWRVDARQIGVIAVDRTIEAGSTASIAGNTGGIAGITASIAGIAQYALTGLECAATFISEYLE